MRWFLTIAVALCAWRVADGSCANLCSGHGTCGGANKCTCFTGWTAADCSRRMCPQGSAWADKASTTNTAHSTMECSNRGVCDYSRGVCMCAPGFDGDACQRSTCLRGCSGHGTCQTLAMMALAYGPDVGTGKGPAYTNWEKNSMMSCFCDYGYQGPDCSLRMCPKNDDPLTTGQAYRSVVLTVAGSSSALAGTVTFTFNGRSVTMPANANSNSDAICTAAISSLPNVGSATCVMSNVDGTTQGATYTITFTSWPTGAVENNVFFHYGNPSLSQFSCNVLGVTSANSPTCSIVDGTTANVIEHSFCSNRGICDFTTGLCTCFLDYKSYDCNQPSNIPDNIDDNDGFLIQPSGTSYVGTALHIHTIKSMATDFQMIEIDAGSSKLFYMTGNGDTYWTIGNVAISSGTLFVKSGATIQTGGLQVMDGGATILNSPSASTVLNLIGSNLAYTGSVLQVQATQGASGAFYLLRAMANGTPLFDVLGNGLTTVRQSGLSVLLGGATIVDATPTATTATVQNTNGAFTGTLLTVTATAASAFPNADFKLLQGVAGGTTAFQVEASGRTTIANGGLSVNGIGGATITNQDPLTPGLTVLSANNAFQGTVAKIQSTVAASALFYLLQATANGLPLFTILGTGQTEIYAGGLKVDMGGATVSNGGLVVGAGGATINGGLQVASGGATIADTGLVVSDGGASVTQQAQLFNAMDIQATHAAFQKTVLSVSTTIGAAASFYLFQAQAAGVPIFDVLGTGRTTVRQGGMVVAAGGQTITHGGLTVGDTGVTIATGGLKVSETGASVTSTLNSDVVSITSDVAGFQKSVLQLVATAAAAASFYLVQIYSASTTPLFDVRGDGRTTVRQGGFVVLANGASITDGLTVTSGGAAISGDSSVTGAFSVSGTSTLTSGATISNTGLLISAGGATITGATSIAGTTSVTVCLTSQHWMSVHHHKQWPPHLCRRCHDLWCYFHHRVSDVTTLAVGATITNNGLLISGGGATITGATSVTGATTLTGTLGVSGATTLAVGATITNNGLLISGGGATIT
ncbi:hypothetical protein ACHHYP_14571, partial [Achlya hypogyna]